MGYINPQKFRRKNFGELLGISAEIFFFPPKFLGINVLQGVKHEKYVTPGTHHVRLVRLVDWSTLSNR